MSYISFVTKSSVEYEYYTGNLITNQVGTLTVDTKIDIEKCDSRAVVQKDVSFMSFVEY